MNIYVVYGGLYDAAYQMLDHKCFVLRVCDGAAPAPIVYTYFLCRLSQVGLDQLDVSALIKVLTEPKNAMVAQYHALFEMVCGCVGVCAREMFACGAGGFHTCTIGRHVCM